MELKLGFSSLGCPSYTVDQVVDAAVSFGYKGVSLRTVRGESLLTRLEEFSPAGIGATRSKFDAAGIKVLCVASGVRFTSADPKERAEQLETAGKYIAMARELGSPYVRIFGGPYPDGLAKAEVDKWIIEGFRASCDIAAREGVSVLLETHDSFSRGESAAALLRLVDRKNLFVVWDILHSLRFGESFEETWAYVGPMVRHVHLKDSSSYGPETFDLKLLGKGKVPVREAVALLLANDYKGYLEFEWEKGWHPDIPGPEIAFPHGAGWLECLWQGLGGDRA
jgi:sugar phosphate isomerase/epimerase